MSKKLLWLVVSGLMVLSLVVAACGPATAEQKKPAPVVEEKKPAPVVEEKKQEAVEKEAVKPAAEAPKYGGVLTLLVATEQTDFDTSHLVAGGSGDTNKLTNQELWAGDWTKGPAGGYGTNELRYESNDNDLFDKKAGQVAESVKWTIDDKKGEGTIIYQIRQGIHYSLNPKSEASRLVAGREVTADDVVLALRRVTTDVQAYIYKSQPELRVAEVTKTGPWEVRVKLPLKSLVSGISRLSDNHAIYPLEVVKKYGDMSNWRNSVGSGPFIFTDYVPGSTAVMVRNPNYWRKDPIGLGKDNQLPYLDGVRYLIIPDKSTQQAALRTAKLDQMSGISWEDAIQLRKTTPALLEAEGSLSGQSKVTMSWDKPPFNDVRVRRAMMMAIDFEGILQSVYGGKGQYLTFPQEKIKGYEDLYLGLDDPEMTESIRELYGYHPDKARQLLKEAGYPNGFKTSLLLAADAVDAMSILKDMWAKVGVDVTLDVRDRAIVSTTIGLARSYDGLALHGKSGPAIFYVSPQLVGESAPNGGRINDPIINKAMDEIRLVAITDMKKAMRLYKEMTKYVLDQALVIPSIVGVASIFWWPWIKNYSGEISLGYYNANNWAEYVWLDEALKKSMGY